MKYPENILKDNDLPFYEKKRLWEKKVAMVKKVLEEDAETGVVLDMVSGNRIVEPIKKKRANRRVEKFSERTVTLDLDCD